VWDAVQRQPSSASCTRERVPYASTVDFLVWLLVIAVFIGAGVWAWSRRSYLLAKALGQPESRIKREIERRNSSG